MAFLTAFTFISFALFSTVRSGETELCPLTCYTDRLPVCAYHPHSGYRSFPSKCALEVELRCNQGSGWVVRHQGECTPEELGNTVCPQVCTREYNPVCGYSPYKGYKTYSNNCQLKIAQCQNKGWVARHDGECTAEELSNSACPQVCPTLYDPVCAYSPYKGYAIYSNTCQLKIAQCQNKDYKFAHHGKCTSEELATPPACPKLCTFEYSPVCGRSRYKGYATFSNKCELQNTTCKYEDYELAHSGKCTPEELATPPVCPKFCTLDISPVCGYSRYKGYSDFSNICKLESTYCNYEDYVYAHKGKCTPEELGTTPDCTTTVCSEGRYPVCGYSATEGYATLSNRCLYKHAQCAYGDYVFVHHGECTPEELGYPPDCTSVCTEQYNPLCAYSPTIGYTTFSSECRYKNAKCKHGDYRFSHHGECTKEELEGKCTNECPLIYIGVCGYSHSKGYKTFPNTCFIEKENCLTQSDYREAHAGKCTPAEIGNICPCNCHSAYSPVCGKSPTKGYYSFPNYCYLDQKNGCDFEDYEYSHDGECYPWETCSNCKKIYE